MSDGEVQARLAAKRDRYARRCHAVTVVYEQRLMNVSHHKAACVLPGGHDGPHETRVKGEPWLFPRDDKRDLLGRST